VSVQNEAGFWQLIRKNLKKSFLFTRIENIASPGVPDVFWTSFKDGQSGWIELKIIRGRKMRFGQEQVAWIKRHADLGLNVKILARKDDTIFLWEGSDISEVATQGIETEEKKIWNRPFPWAEIIDAIMVPGRPRKR
jgi:hypothetical protein